MLDPEGILKETSRRNCRRVALQFPEGLRREALKLADSLQSRGLEVVLVGEPCHGACDLAEVPCDLLVHIGHAPIGGGREDVLFEEARVDAPLDVLEKAALLLMSPLGLVVNLQHIHQLPEIRRALEGRGLKVLVGRGGKRVAHEGQVLGCDFSAAMAVEHDVKSFLYFGTGDFHPLGLALVTGRPVVAADPFTREVKDMTGLRERFLRQRFAAIELASEAKRFGVLVSTKKGQSRPELARRLAGKLTEKGRKAFVFHFGEVVPEHLEGYGLDAFVSTACPRLAVDDHMRFKRPILNPKELEIALGERAWKDYELETL